MLKGLLHGIGLLLALQMVTEDGLCLAERMSNG